jgi:hypothetical protein
MPPQPGLPELSRPKISDVPIMTPDIAVDLGPLQVAKLIEWEKL